MKDKNDNTLYKATTQLEQTLIQRVEELEQINLRLQMDIEARKLAREGLRYGQKFLREVISSVEDTYFTVFDQDCIVNFIWGSKKLEKKYGIIFQDYMGKDSNDFNLPLAKKVRQVFETNQSFHGEWYEDRQKNRIWWDFTVSPIRDEDNEMVAVVSAARDITVRKKTEEKLIKSEEILRSTIESIVEGILVVNETGQITHYNSKFISMWHIPQELADEKDDQNLINFVLDQLNDPEAFQSKVRQLYSSRSEDFNTLKFKDGRIFERNSNPLVINGEITGRVWCFRDITERIKNEELLKESEERFRKIIENSEAGYFFINSDGYFQHVNNAWLRMHKFSTTDEIIGKNFSATQVDIDLPEAIKIVERLLHGDPIPTSEFTRRCKDGSIEYHTFSANPVIKEGKIIGLEGFIIDITESKKIEEDLRIQSEILANMVEGVYLIRIDNGMIVYTNPVFEEMFGYNPGEMIGKEVSIVNAPTNKSPEETKEEIIKILLETGEWHGEINNIKKDGTPFWCNANASLFDHPEYGKVIISIHTDISERRKIESNKGIKSTG
jgi:PAS domain S-box-containing protein